MATLSNNTSMDKERVALKQKHIKHLGLIIIVAITRPSLAGAIDTIWHKMMQKSTHLGFSRVLTG